MIGFKNSWDFAEVGIGCLAFTAAACVALATICLILKAIGIL